MAQEPMRADARRNRARILASARELYAERGRELQMDEIAAHAELGIGSLYRHFPNKQALLSAIVRERFTEMTALAEDAERVPDAGAAFAAVLTGYLEAAEGDAGFQLAMLGSNDLEWAGIHEHKDEFAAVVARIIDRAVRAGAVRPDLTYDDFPTMTCGVMSTMYFKPGGSDWRRHLAILLAGLAPTRTE